MLAALKQAVRQTGVVVRAVASRNSSSAPIYELRQYNIVPDMFPSFMSLTTQNMHLRTKHSKLIGYWTAEIGGLNQVVHIWEYRDLQQRSEVRAGLANDAVWMQTYIAKMRPFLSSQTNCYMLPQMPLKPVSGEGGVYVLRVDRPQPFTTVSTVESRKVEFARNAHMIGVWQTVLSGERDAGEIVQLLRFASYNELDEYAPKLAERADSVAASHCKMLLPCSFSPLR